MGTITTPGGTWVPTLAAEGIIPWFVWQTMYLANLKIGRGVVLVVLLHSLYNMNSVRTHRMISKNQYARSAWMKREKYFSFLTKSLISRRLGAPLVAPVMTKRDIIRKLIQSPATLGFFYTSECLCSISMKKASFSKCRQTACMSGGRSGWKEEDQAMG